MTKSSDDFTTLKVSKLARVMLNVVQNATLEVLIVTESRFKQETQDNFNRRCSVDERFTLMERIPCISK